MPRWLHGFSNWADWSGEGVGAHGYRTQSRAVSHSWLAPDRIADSGPTRSQRS